MNCSVRLTAPVLLGLLLCGSPLHAQPPSTAATHRTHADQLNAKFDYRGALKEYQAAYALDKSKHPKEAAQDLDGIGDCQEGLRRFPEAVGFYRQEAIRQHRAGDRGGEAETLGKIGAAYEHLGQSDQAMLYGQQALTLASKIGDAKIEGHALFVTGWVYSDLGQYGKGMDLEQQALALALKTGDTVGRGKALCEISSLYDVTSQFDKALTYGRQALTLARKAADQKAEISALSCIGSVYDHLGQFASAITFHQQVIAKNTKIGDTLGLEQALCSLGIVYRKLHQYDKALSCVTQSLALARKIGDLRGQEDDLANIGIVYERQEKYDTALGYIRQALTLDRKIGDVRGEDEDLGNLGSIYEHLEKNDLAVAQYSRALMLERQIGDVLWEGDTFENLMLISSKIKQPALAVYYGKQSVNAYQTIRAGVAHLDAATQKSYLATVEKAYRSLADLLITQGRLPEAEQVLAMLKGEEASDFVSRDATLTPATIQVNFSPDEKAAAARYQALADPVTKIGQQIETLRAKKGRTDAEDAQLVALQDQLTPAKQQFEDFLSNELPKEMTQAKPDAPRPDILTMQGPLERQLAQMGPGTVALFTLVLPDKYRVIVVTSQTTKAEEYPIKATDLRKKVLAWRQALSDPRLDPRPLGQELTTVLIGPIEKDLIGAKATTLMWSLDDVLRYVPVGALYDGKHYLVEKYRTTVFTGASVPALSQAAVVWQSGPTDDPVLLALGVTQPHTVPNPSGGQALTFPALPGVDREIRQVARYTGNPGGALAGKSMTDAQFTQDTFRRALAHGYPVVHVASHFELGLNTRSSFLLLGDGTALTLDALCGQGGQVFQGVDLLTLSACQTGESGGDGHEFESLAALAQQQGASSVLASLWPVSDASTPLLMQAFYRLRADTPDTSKAESLRQAQLALLHGTAPTAQTAAPGRGTALSDTPHGGDGQAPAFVPDTKAPYAHPFYWAPFVLIGNWR